MPIRVSFGGSWFGFAVDVLRVLYEGKHPSQCLEGAVGVVVHRFNLRTWPSRTATM